MHFNIMKKKRKEKGKRMDNIMKKKRKEKSKKRMVNIMKKKRKEKGARKIHFSTGRKIAAHSGKTKRKVVHSVKKHRKNVPKKSIRKNRIKKLVRKMKHKFVSVAKKSSEESGKISLGIENFDSLIGGGFEKNSTNLVVGATGCGKTIFATQFLVGGLKKGEPCLYVTFEETKEQFYKNMKEFGWNLEEYEKKGLFTFLEYTPSKVRSMLDEGGGTIENVIVGKKVTRMVIDSISSFELLFKDELEKREAELSLFSMLRGWNCTTLLTFDQNPLNQTNSRSNILEFEVDSIIAFYYLTEKGRRQRYVEVLKMRGREHSNRVYGAVLGRKGFGIGKKPVNKSFS